MKKAVFIFVFVFLYLLLFSFLCFNEDTNEQMYILNASGREYQIDYHLLYNKIIYFEDSGKSSIPEIDIKWSRILTIAATVGIGIYMFIEHRRKYKSK